MVLVGVLKLIKDKINNRRRRLRIQRGSQREKKKIAKSGKGGNKRNAGRIEIASLFIKGVEGKPTNSQVCRPCFGAM